MTSSKADQDRINHAREADAEALDLLETIRNMDRIPMEDYLRESTQSAEVVAALAFVAIKAHARSAGAAGGLKRHAPMADLRSWALAKYHEGKWPSANKAAHDLQGLVLEHGRTIGANLAKENAQRTISEWIRDSKRSV